jgi:hypothetical protein
MIIPVGDEIKSEEVFAPITDMVVPGVGPGYSISTWGRVYNATTGNTLPKNINYNKNHYITIRLNDIIGNPIMVQPHRVLLMTFNYVDGCELLDVNHIDGVKYHNWIWNLEWNTRKQNIEHAINNGLFNLGETRKGTVITNEQAHYICQLIQDGKSPSEIETITGIPGSASISSNIKAGLSWKHIACQYDFSNAFSRGPFTDQEIHMICQVFWFMGVETPTRDILNIIGYKYSEEDMNNLVAAVSSYRKRKCRRDICDQYDY